MKEIDDGTIELSFNQVLVEGVSRLVFGHEYTRGFNHLSKFILSCLQNIRAVGRLRIRMFEH